MMKRDEKILAVVAGVMVGMGVVGCGKPVVEPPGAGVSDGVPAEREITLYTWSEYFDPELLEAFRERTGVRVNYEVFGSTDEMEAKLRSQPTRYDVIVADDSVTDRLAELRLVRELDHGRLPNLANVDGKYLDLPFDRGNRYSVPYMWGTTLVAYRKDRVQEPERSWSLLWDPALAGRVMMVGERFELLSLALLKLGYPLNSDDPEHIAAAKDALVEQLEKVGVVYGDDASIRDGLDTGEVWASMAYSGDAAMVAAENENVGYFIPQEGAPLWIDSFSIPRDSEKEDLAHLFIDYMLEAEVAAASSNYTYYATANAAARPYVDAEVLEDETIFPPAAILEKCEFWQMISDERERLLNQAWYEVIRAKAELEGGEGSSDDDRVGQGGESGGVEAGVPGAGDGAGGLEGVSPTGA